MADDSEMFSAEVQEAAITEDFSVAMEQSQIMETPMLGVPGPQIEETNGSVEPEEVESLKLPDLPTPTATPAPPTLTPIPTYTPTPSFTYTSAGIEMLTTPTSSPTPTDTLTPLPSPTATLIPTATPLPSMTPTMVIPSATPMVLAVAATEPPIEPLMLESPSVLPRGELPTPETPPAASQLPTALLIGEMFLMAVAMLTGLIALILFIRSRR